MIGGLFGAALAAVAFATLAHARGHGTQPEDLSVVLFAALFVGWVTLPILTFGSDDLLDPARRRGC